MQPIIRTASQKLFLTDNDLTFKMQSTILETIAGSGSNITVVVSATGGSASATGGASTSTGENF